MYRALLFLILASVLVPQVSAEQPNVIYILLDDAGYGDLSCYGQKKFATPNIDRLATEGIRFTDHYSGSTVCAPTRCSLMTGLHTGHCFVRGNREVKPEGQSPMPADIVTIPRLLHQAGYTTGMFGKWGLGAPGSTSDPMQHFDSFYGYNCQREAHNFYPDHLWKNDQRVELDGNTYSHDLIIQNAFDFIRTNKKGPFFCYMSVTIPHAAMQVPEDSMAEFRKKFAQFEGTIGKYAGPDVNNPVAGFAGMMTRLDQQVGQLLALLKELDIDDNTLVMLSSDNGPHKEGGHQPDFFDSNGPLRGYKRDLYEGGGLGSTILFVCHRQSRPGPPASKLALPPTAVSARADTPQHQVPTQDADLFDKACPNEPALILAHPAKVRQVARDPACAVAATRRRL